MDNSFVGVHKFLETLENARKEEEEDRLKSASDGVFTKV